jgi:hypothetical protein
MRKAATSAALAVLVLSQLWIVGAVAQSSGLHWIVSQSSVKRLRAAMPSAQVNQLFDNPNTYVIVNMPHENDGLPQAKHVLFYRDEKLMAADLAAGKLNGFDGVLYDDEEYNEPGNTTPEDQKANPLPYVQDAAKILHAAGKILVYTIGPGTGPQGSFWRSTLPSVSPYPDVIDFQTQAAEGTPRFEQQVARYSQVYRASGGHLMLVGLAASPKGEFKSEQDIRGAYDAALANRPPVDGFWLNMAVKSRSCTGCASSLDISPMVQFLQSTLH